MAPSMPRSLMLSSSGLRSTCFQRPLVRSFASSPCLLQVGPESPKFIEVPQPPQQRYPPKRRIKGVLPTPRNLFRGNRDKISPEYLAAATPEPTTEHGTSRSQWKQQMAATRRRNLREGLVELHHRKKQMDRAMAGRSAYRRAEHERLVHAPEREDERLTRPTVTEAMKQFNTGIVPDPDREARIAQKLERYRAMQEAKANERRDALHTLYTQAGSFITTQDQLNAAIEKTFVDNPEEFGNDIGVGGENIWNRGPPETVQQMLSEANKSGNNALRHHTGSADLTQKRIKKIAEELTGGKV
ncbi:MAG: hypothetical protein M1819_005202 [Sarea resinae]|nr:MAG: hypothetical protein M1819_005202 [Sarea resinae]